ncbi:hypothetical protein T492DRAFT_992601, partial [Pavlovales sp. CCMP2436]
MRVAARTAKRRAGLPTRQEATVAPRSSPMAAGKPRANASSRAPAKPAQTQTSCDGGGYRRVALERNRGDGCTML